MKRLGVSIDDSQQTSPEEPNDVASFRLVLEKRVEIFMERRETYGSHLENAKRFPLEHTQAMAIKCGRLLRMIEDGRKIDDDTLMDIGNYADIILSAHSQFGYVATKKKEK